MKRGSGARKYLVPAGIVLAIVAAQILVLSWLRFGSSTPGAIPFPAGAPIEGLPSGVVSVSGLAESAREGSGAWRRLSARDRLGEGDRIRTGPSGRIEVDLGGKSRIHLGPSANLRLTALDDPDSGGAEGILVNLDRGAALIDVKGLRNLDGFKVVTPTTTCGVRGTRFLVTVEGMEGPAGAEEDENP